MIFVTFWQRISLDEQPDCLAELRHVLPAFPGKLDVAYDVDGGEQRWTVVGVLIVVFTIRGDSIRVVTAFEASRRMNIEYFAMKGR
jgi:uncharacterized DUF497 family protein